MKFKNCGKKTYKEIKDTLKKHGVSWIPAYCPGFTVAEANESLQMKNENEINSLEEIIAKLKNVSIENADLSVRSYNCLAYAKIKTLYDFAILSEYEAYQIPNLGKRSIAEIAKKIQAFGVSYPIKKSDYLNRERPVKFLGISNFSIEYLSDKNINTLEELIALDNNDYECFISELPISDVVKILFMSSLKKAIKLNDRNYNDYVRFAISEICKPFNENEKQILSLAFGLNDNKIWPTDVLASTLAISENSMSTIVKNICINFLTEENIKRLSPGIQYCKEKGEDFFYKNGYSLLLKNINELCKKAEQDE